MYGLSNQRMDLRNLTIATNAIRHSINEFSSNKNYRSILKSLAMAITSIQEVKDDACRSNLLIYSGRLTSFNLDPSVFTKDLASLHTQLQSAISDLQHQLTCQQHADN